MLRLVRRAYAVFKAYFISDFIRSKGGFVSLLSLALWIVMFILPMFMFADRSIPMEEISARAFVGVMMFIFYSMATWDWATEIRWMINDGRIEYYIASNSGFLPHFLGILPVSIIWLIIALGLNYIVLSVMIAPPRFTLHDPLLFLCGFVILLTTLVSYALILGGSVISTGSAGVIIEIIGFVLPIATGGLVPLRNMPHQVQVFALLTPFSYPAEIIRYGVMGIEPVLSLDHVLLIGSIYSVGFLITASIYFKTQLRKTMKTGFKSLSMW